MLTPLLQYGCAAEEAFLLSHENPRLCRGVLKKL